MRIGIVGASASGLYCALLIKRKHPDYHVSVFDKNDKIGKKIYATGNGRCNLLNSEVSGDSFNNPSFVDSLLKRYPYETLEGTLNSFGVVLTYKGSLAYPITESAPAFVHHLVQLVEKNNIDIHLSEKVLDYKQADSWDLKTEKGTYKFDKLIFAFGGKSQKNLGSDGSLFPMLESHGYHIEETIPGLCPIKTVEKTKSLSGLRHDALVRLYENGKEFYNERGEVLFKDDGLSGIVVFNCESIISRRKTNGTYRLVLDLLPDYSLEEINDILAKEKSLFGSSYLEAILPKPLSQYVIGCSSDLGVAATLKSLPFTLRSVYPFESSQVTIGGISIDEIDEKLASKRETGVYFAGECLDIDGLCGGFNLSWCLLSAMAISDAI